MRGPVDRSLDAAHATNRTTGETAKGMFDTPGNVIVNVVTAPFRLIGRLGEALFGP